MKKTIEDLVVKSVMFKDRADDILGRHIMMTLEDMSDCLSELVGICTEDYGFSQEEFTDVDDAASMKQLVHQLIDASYKKAAGMYCHIRALDSDLTSYIRLSADCSRSGTGKITMKQLDDLKTGNAAAINGKIRIVDISRANYEKSS